MTQLSFGLLHLIIIKLPTIRSGIGLTLALYQQLITTTNKARLILHHTMHTQGNPDDVRPDDQATSSPITTLGSARSSLTIPEPPFAHVQPACFQTLPPELQQKIWKEAVADPMIYQLQIHKYFMTSIDLFCVTYFEEEISLSA